MKFPPDTAMDLPFILIKYSEKEVRPEVLSVDPLPMGTAKPKPPSPQKQAEQLALARERKVTRKNYLAS